MSDVKAMFTVDFTGLTNGQTYYARVYTMSVDGYMQSEVGTQIGSATPQDFPAEPTSYTLIDTYTTSQTWTAPEDGYFQIELHGASGSGAAGLPTGSAWYTYEDEDSGDSYWFAYSGPSGGGGAYACSRVKLKKGDTVTLVCGSVGADTTANIASSMSTYDPMRAVSGGSAVAGSTSNRLGTAGTAGTASGGNVSNLPGSVGLVGARGADFESSSEVTTSPRAGGAPGHVDGNNGGYGGYATSGTKYGATSGKAGFFKISRGNTNAA